MDMGRHRRRWVRQALITAAVSALGALGPGVAPALAVAPTVTSSPPTAVGPDGFTGHGTVNPNGTDTHFQFEEADFGTAYATFANSTDVGAGTSPVAASEALRAVSDWTYHVNLHAYNSGGDLADGTDQTVTTPPYASRPGAPGDLDVPGTTTHSAGFAVQGRAGPTNDGSDPSDGAPNNYPDDAANALALYPSGAIVVAGTASASGNTTLPNGFELRRYTAAGVPDSTFTPGEPALTFSGESGVSGNAVGLQKLTAQDAADAIVVAGTGTSSSGTDVLLARFTAAGEPDGDFGTGGSGQLIEAGGGSANALVVAPDHTLWVAGGAGNNAVVWHFDAAGTTVLSKTTVPGTGPATALVRQSDGALVAAAGRATTFELIRVTTTGALDSGFGAAGVLSVPAPGPALAAAVDEHLCTAASCPQREIVVAGGNATRFALARVTESGALDTGFGHAGIVTTTATGSPARALVVQSDGKPVAGGVEASSTAGPEMLLTRYTVAGALDPSFGIGGRVHTGYPDAFGDTKTPSGIGADAEVNALGLMPDGRIVAAGIDANAPQIIVAPPPGRRTLASPRPGTGQIDTGDLPDVAVTRYQGGPPTTKITFTPPATTGAQDATFAFASNLTGSRFQCRIDSGAFANCTSGQAFGPLSFATHTFTVRAIDHFNHVDPAPPSYRWTICSGCDTTPRTSLTGEPPALTNARTATFTFIADDPSDTFQCQLDGGAFSPCASPDQLAGVADGSHTFVVRAVNGLGPDPAPPSYRWTVDTVAPHTTITSGPSGTLTSPTATFAFTSSKPGSSFQCKLDGAAFTPCISPMTYLVAAGKHTFFVRAVDPAGNLDPAPPSRTFTFVQAQCSQTVGFYDVAATGCFGKQSGRFVSTPGSDVNLNGLTVHPGDATTTITIDPVAHKITSTGTVTVSASEVPLDQEKLAWSVPAPSKGTETLPALNPPQGAGVEGLPFEGDVSLSLKGDKSSNLAGNVQLPLGTIAGALGINGTVTMQATPAAGLQHDKLTVERDDLQIGGIGIKQLKVAYDQAADIWEGAASIELPTPNKLGIAADLQFQHGSFHSFSGSVDNLNFPIVSGIYLQRIAVVFGIDPTTIGGGLGLSFGPQVDGSSVVRVDGNFLYQATFGGNPGHVHVDGTVTLAGYKLANGYFDYFTSGLTKFGAQAQIGLPNDNDPKPKSEPVYIDAALAGVIQAPHFDVDVKANVDLNFIDTSVSAEVLASDLGLVACAHLSAFGFGWSPGASYTWANHDFNLIGDSCSVGSFETLPIASAAAAGRATLRLPAGGALIGLTGATAQPRVTLTGPHGRHISVPTTSVAPEMVPGFMVLQDPTDKVTYIAVQHSTGIWRVALEPGSSPITHIRDAALLPPAHVSVKLRGRGRRRTLSWHLTPEPGQRVTFWEKGRDSAHIIGSARRPSGRLHFTIANGSRGRRTIVAQVLNHGRPRADLKVAHFTAPGPAKPGKPGHLKVVWARGGAVRVSWSRSAIAQQYIVEVDTGDGAHLMGFAAGRTHAITVHDVVPIQTARVKVTAALVSGLKGPTATARYPAPKKKHKPPKKHTPPKRRSGGG
jgi:uncharacterized delta-60 repeat protein